MNKKILVISVIILVAILSISAIIFIYQDKGKDTEEKNIGVKTCLEQNGKVCSTSETCSDSWIKSFDSERCCNKTCRPYISISIIDKSFFGTNDYVKTTDIYSDQIKNMNDIGMGIERLSPHAVRWFKVKKDILDDQFDFKGLSFGEENFDKIYEVYYKNNIELVLTLIPIAPDSYKNSDEKKAKYLEYIRTIVERYDGDKDYGCKKSVPDCYISGDNQYPQWTTNPKITYYQLENELDGTDWAKNPALFADVFMETYKAMKEVCSDCQLILAGQSGEGGKAGKGNMITETYVDVIDNLNPKQLDWSIIIDNHFYKSQGHYKIYSDRIKQYKSILMNKGFKSIKFWSTEMATHTGDPFDEQNLLIYQTEQQQAIEGVKRFIELISQGTEVIMWSKIIENSDHNNEGPCGSRFNFMGLINNKNSYEICFTEKDGKISNLNHPKLMYYSYKKLIEEIVGSDRNIMKKDLKNNVYLYTTTKNNTPFYIIWWDWYEEFPPEITYISKCEEKNIHTEIENCINEYKKAEIKDNNPVITLNIPNTNSVKITESIPKYTTGKEVMDYNTAFNSETKEVINGKLTLTLGKNPVYIEIIK